jgi:hypothetical protein
LHPFCFVIGYIEFIMSLPPLSVRKRGVKDPRPYEPTTQAAEDAVARIMDSLGTAVSPHLGKVNLQKGLYNESSGTSTRYRYERTEESWLERALTTDDNDAMETDELVTGSANSKKPRILERATTPIISNASHRSQDRDEIMSPVPLRSPSPTDDAGITGNDTYLRRTPTTLRTGHVAGPSSRHDALEYGRYHDAVLRFVQVKRRVTERVELKQRSLALQEERTSPRVPFDDAMELVPDDLFIANRDGDALILDETRADVAFLRSLHNLSSDHVNASDARLARKEGNFWLLLSHLRELSLDTLIWADDAASSHQHESSLLAYVDSLAAKVNAAPLELTQALQLNTSECPSLLRRRQCIMRWLEACFHQQLPTGSTRPRHATIICDSKLLRQEGLPETDKDAEILKNALALILAGREEDAQILARDSGAPWRAALWSGGKPQGVVHKPNLATETMDRIPTGNPRRALWKRMMWKNAEALHQKGKAAADEAAIAAILSNNLKIALLNPSLRTWEKCLYVAFRCMIGRTEDDLLHKHNNLRRQYRPPFPGTQFAQHELQQLRDTADIAAEDEASVIHNILPSSVFDEVKDDDVVTDATSSFLVGKSSIASYLQDSMADLDDAGEMQLRFLTHLGLYLDSLAVGTTPIFIQGVSDWKNRMLLKYLQYLSTREELWHLLVLYASLLPESVLTSQLPNMLQSLDSQEGRRTIVEQMRELLPRAGLDLVVLQNVVQATLQTTDTENSCVDTPTRLDVQKMRSIAWLSYSQDHTVDALVFSNSLLRHFLLGGRRASAILFVEDFRLESVLELAEGNGEDEAADVDTWRREHMALQYYLDATQAIDHWREIISTVESTTKLIDDRIDIGRLDETDVSVALKIERRALLEQKRKASFSVVRASNSALKALSAVLKYRGGWLLLDYDAASRHCDQNARSAELDALRRKILPHCISSYCEVCMETAVWMSSSMDDAVAQLSESPSAVLDSLDSPQDGEISPIAPFYWPQQALEIANVVASETYGILSAFGTAEKKQLVSDLAEASVANLFYTTKRD